ncbi:hypothetical protein RND81_10G024500 [Saponaria officinalis]|uniref:Receptor-like serine/threonine-protein kinase n=1 Tax=Saponaria officinalis TaxID=3572 RepID=A0AAW1HXV0_SAPOF
MKLFNIIPIFFVCFFPVYSKLSDTLTKTEFLSINQTLISSGGKFELGFFQRGNPIKYSYYLGIWYKDIPSNVIIWVANRNAPSFSNSSIFHFGNNSNIVLSNGGSMIIWETHQLNLVNPVIQLLDSGNLVVREVWDSNPDNFMWQSFDYPTDTLVPGQKLGVNLKTGLDRVLVSWVSRDEPGIGNFNVSLDYKSGQEIYVRNFDKIFYRSGPWDGHTFGGVSGMMLDQMGFNLTLYDNSDEVYYTVLPSPNTQIKIRTTLNCYGNLESLVWISDSNRWNRFWYTRQDQCDYYGACGPYGICNVTSFFVCKCPKGFKPKKSNAWELRQWIDGCVRETILDCKNDGFLQLDNIKLPRISSSFVDKTLNLDQCRERCKNNCSCVAYANSIFDNEVGFGCRIWTDDLIDMRIFVEGGHTLYIRLSASDLASNEPSKKRKVHIGTLAIASIPTIIILLVTLTTWIICKRRSSSYIYAKRMLDSRGNCHMIKKRQEILHSGQIITCYSDYCGEAKNADDVELPIFDIYSMAYATDNFSDANKLGQGGFGSVYKGVMVDGQEVAIKRLSRESGQGTEEFKNEVRLIAKLQHRNLVRLIGCSVDMNEKMLIYEFLPNRSLDLILFHKGRNSVLNWQTRFNIICGVARGILYLHQDSRYRIIHRDLKASNILLDADMNPKISDFGMARIFGGDETQGNTMRVVGTYGYMAPEFAMNGIFSTKSDVYSFGVLVLEILSGMKNRGFVSSDTDLNLLGYAWDKWRNGQEVELLDKSIGETTQSTQQVSRCVQVGLLCVQERPEDRPTMGSVLLMLSGDSISLPQPTLPGFHRVSKPSETDSSSNKHDQSVTVNQVTLTIINPR